MMTARVVRRGIRRFCYTVRCIRILPEKKRRGNGKETYNWGPPSLSDQDET
jgi:hypothetical protein